MSKTNKELRHWGLSVTLLAALLLGVGLQPGSAEAKKKKKAAKAPVSTEVQGRFQNLSAEDQRLFDSLSEEQQNLIRAGKIDKGFNAVMVKWALGEPFYGTEHHPVFTDYEEVWLYTKKDVKSDRKENRIIDPQTNWPTIHRIETTKTCVIGDFFVLWDRGVVQAIHPDPAPKVYGTCTIETQEAFLPIVDGKPVEPR